MNGPLEKNYLEGEKEDYYKLPKHEIERRLKLVQNQEIKYSNWFKEVGIKNA